jgi:hypothetical protein
MAKVIPTGKAWIDHWFSAKAAHNGGVIRRKIESLEKYASYQELIAEVRLRNFHLIRCGGQYIVLCNTGRIKLLH